MTDNFKIPKEFYVGLQQRGDLTLAFLTPNGTDKAALKRIDTVNTWAGRCYSGAVELASKVVTNELLSGYSIEKCVYRTYWGGGNVVWTIQDPRGFAFEISSSNMAKLLECVTIINGVIQGECIIGRNGQQNVLLPKDSQPYKDAVAFTIMNSTAPTISVKDVLPGSRIEHKAGYTNTYLGKYFTITNSNAFHNRKYIIEYSASAKPSHFYYSYDDTTLEHKYGISSYISPPAIDKVIPNYINKNIDILAHLNSIEYISCAGNASIVSVIDTKSSPKNFRIELEETTEIGDVSINCIIIKFEDKFYLLRKRDFGHFTKNTNNRLTYNHIKIKNNIVTYEPSASSILGELDIDNLKKISNIVTYYKLYAYYNDSRVDITNKIKY